jgi:acyl-CoA reductase-like NAD-dependent aldehyde dehydrogenase
VFDTKPAAVEMVIGGETVEALDGRRIDVESPADRRVIATVPRGDSSDVDRAVRAAAAAFGPWRNTAPRDRGRMISLVAEALQAESEEIARELARETGNAIRTQSRPEVNSAADFFRYFGGLATEVKGEVIPLGEGLLNYNKREPHGVVGAIVAWNSPLMLAVTKITMAIMTGNTVVLKAPEDAPLAILRMARACQRHLPPGVVNVITGYGEEAGAALVRHPMVAKLTFTGSTEVGREIASAAGSRVVSVVLELGGKSPAIVFPDSDTDAVADGVIAGMRFTRQGQGCTAGSRLFVHESILDSFLERLAIKLERMRIGDPLDEQTDIGSLINRKQFDRVCSYIEDGLHSGAHAVIGGLPDPVGPLAGGYFVSPTIFKDVDPTWRISREEIFGPVLVAIPWTDDSEAIAMANDSHYGLSAYVWCRDISRALRTAHAIESGGVQINRGLGPVPGMSDGGIKQSGFGREHSLEGALDDFTYRKSIVVDLNF